MNLKKRERSSKIKDGLLQDHLEDGSLGSNIG